MTKQRSKQKKTSGKGASRRRGKHDDSDRSTQQEHSAFKAVRETVESIVIAFVLAFLFRTFEAEAFVIPTGSMAPTLLGRNKDVECDECGFAYQASASSENNDERNKGRSFEDREIVVTSCPVCHYTMTVAPHPSEPGAEQEPTYSGDRILVDKISYQIGDPKRWDVFVFKWPQESATNYIKRLVGLPNETLKIEGGDIHVDRGEGFYLARRSHVPDKLVAMLQVIHDNHHIPRTLVKAGWPHRWMALQPDVPGGWTSPAIDFSEEHFGRQRFETDGSSQEARWLRYGHVVPMFEQWESMQQGVPLDEPPRRFLITDFYAYNTAIQRFDFAMRATDKLLPVGKNWVGDLAVECHVEVLGDGGELLLQLVEGGQKFECRVDLGNGAATFWINGADKPLATAATDVRGAGSYQLRFANVDDELLLWVDGELVMFDAYAIDTSVPRALDLEPVGIGGRGAKLRVDHIRVLRDIYYVAVSKLGQEMRDVPLNTDAITFFSAPKQWTAYPIKSQRRKAVFRIGKDEFLPLGDNSPESQDGRIWDPAGVNHTVHRDLLIGKALYIYWPHTWNSPVPFWPNWRRMKLVR